MENGPWRGLRGGRMLRHARIRIHDRKTKEQSQDARAREQRETHGGDHRKLYSMLT